MIDRNAISAGGGDEVGNMARSFLFAHFGLVAILVLVLRYMIEASIWQGVAYGAILFSVNMALLVILAKRFVSAQNSDRKAGQMRLLGLAILKFVFLGVALYLGLDVLRLDPFSLVGGSLLTLVIGGALVLFLFSNSRKSLG